jgi:hypothetical protein
VTFAGAATDEHAGNALIQEHLLLVFDDCEVEFPGGIKGSVNGGDQAVKWHGRSFRSG